MKKNQEKDLSGLNDSSGLRLVESKAVNLISYKIKSSVCYG